MTEGGEGFPTIRVAYLFSGKERRASIAEELRRLCLASGLGLQFEQLDIHVGGDAHDLLDKDLPWLAHVGRLDIMTEGCLLLTNDGELAEQLLLPASGVERVYHVKVRGKVDRKTIAKLENGVVLDGRRTRPTGLSRLATKSKHDWLELTLTEGRNRHVRRIFEAVGHSVTRLRRVSFAGISVEGVARGNWRLLEPKEIASLRRIAAGGVS